MSAVVLIGVGAFLVGVSAGGFSFMLLTNPSVKWANDRIDGLESDLRSAVLCAYMRGAKEWAVLNYPDWRDWLESHEDYAA